MLKCSYCGMFLDEVMDSYSNIHTEAGKITLCKNCLKIHNGIKNSENLENYEACKKQAMNLVNSKKMHPNAAEYTLKLIEEKQNKVNEEKRKEAELQEILKDIEERRKNFICTTSQNFEGYRIVKYIDVISGEAVVGTGFWSELSALFSDSAGTRSFANENKLSLAKSYAQAVLKERALLVGANAIVAIDFDIMTLGSDMITVSANGTAVTIEKI